MKNNVFFVGIILLILCSNSLFGDNTSIESDINEHYLLGKELFDKGDYNNALIEFENIHAIAPEYIDTYTLIGKVEYERKNYLRAAYYLMMTLALKPDDTQARILIDKLKTNDHIKQTEKKWFIWNFKEVPNTGKISYELYGDARYEKYLLSANKVEKIIEPGTYRIPLDLSYIKKFRVLKHFNGKIMDSELNQLKFSILQEKEFDLSPKENPDEYFELVKQYFTLDRVFNAIISFEEVVYHHPKYISEISPAMISRFIDEVDTYLQNEPDNPRGHFFKGFFLYVREKHTEAMSEFFVAQGLNLDMKYMTKKVKYVDICRAKSRENEEKKAKFNAGRIIKSKVRDANILDKLSDDFNEDLASSETISEDEKIYRCTLNRSLIGQGVDTYNQDNIEEMDEFNFDVKKLVNYEYLKKYPQCPNGGKYSLLPGPIPYCSVHGR